MNIKCIGDVETEYTRSHRDECVVQAMKWKTARESDNPVKHTSWPDGKRRLLIVDNAYWRVRLGNRHVIENKILAADILCLSCFQGALEPICFRFVRVQFALIRFINNVTIYRCITSFKSPLLANDLHTAGWVAPAVQGSFDLPLKFVEFMISF